MSRMTSPNPTGSSVTPAQQGKHHQRLQRLRDQERQRRQMIVAIAGMVALIALAGGLAWTDYFHELSAAARAVSWMAIVALIVVAAAASWRWLDFDSSDAVHQAEQLWPEVGQGLRTSHDYQSDPASVTPADPELLRALERETEEHVARQPLQPLGKPWPILALLGCGATAILLWMLGLLIWPEWRIATARLGFLPMHYSDVQMQPLPEILHQGDDLAVGLHVAGRPLDDAQLRYRFRGQKDWQQLDFQPEVSDLLVDDLRAVIPDCQDDVEVQIIAGPLKTQTQLVTVRLPLVLETWKASVKPPSYTGLTATEGVPETLRIPEGSQLDLEAKYNRAPQAVDAGVVPQNEATVATQVAAETAQLSLASLRQPSDLQVKATASDGVSDDSSLHLDVIPDRAPKLKFVAPEENAEAIATAELRFRLEAIDDYGLQSVGIRYRIDDGPELTLWESGNTSPESGASESKTALATSVTLPLEDLGVSYPQAITYYAFALDNREPEPQQITSELRFIDIRPFSREYEFKDGQCSGNCQGECLSLEKLIKEQREILGQTFTAVQRGDTSSEMGSKLAKRESELRSKTESLTTALEQKVGPMPSLVFASGAMIDAEKDLANQAIPDGQVHEEHALAYLVSARTNLRKILKQSNSQAQMCRNVDRQQMDKLRKPPRESKSQPLQQQQQSQQQQLSQLRKQLEKIAQQQQSFCQSASACQQASQSQASQSKPSQSQPSQSQPSQSQPSQSQPSQSQPTQSTGNPSPDPSKPDRPSNPSQPSDDSTPTAEQLADQQRRAAQEMAEIQQALQAGSFGELAPKRADQARESIQRSGQSIAEENDFDDAIAKARQAAEQLQQLSEHLGRRHDPDFQDKLAAAEREAQQLSEAQKQLTDSLGGKDANEDSRQAASDESSAASPPKTAQKESRQQESQRQLAGRAEELADLVDQLLADSTEQEWEIQRELSDQVAENPPQRAAEAMRAAVADLQRGQPRSASSQGTRASALLERLAAGIRQVQRATSLEQLERLTKAEQRAASLIKQLQREGSPAEQAMARAEARQFNSDLQSLSRNDGELARVNQALAAWVSNSTIEPDSLDEEPVDNPQFATTPRRLVDALRDVDVVLQRRIQETIISGAMQQAVGAVPPQYSEMVDDYYRALSEDIE